MVCRTPPQRLEICLIPHGEEMEFGPEKMQASTILRPLEIVRNVKEGDILIRDATIQEVPDFLGRPKGKLRSIMQDQAILTARLTTLVSGGSPVELLFEMYSAVLRHCEAFEQNDNFKDDMGMLSNRKHQNHMYDPSDDGSTTSTNFGSEFSNPFRSDIYTEQTVFHPVEQGLLDAKRFVDEEEDSSNFKNTRAKVLHYLEPQYQRFATTAKNIVDFIKEHKRRGELFDPCRRVRPVHDSRKICIAIVLLEEFAESFKRDIPFSIKWKFRKLQKRIEERYSISPAGFSLCQNMA
jgi:hypothetical protein